MAPGTADRIHEGGVRLCPRGRDARLGRTAWANRVAPSVVTSAVPGDFAHPTRARYDSNLGNGVLGLILIGVFAGSSLLHYSGGDSLC